MTAPPAGGRDKPMRICLITDEYTNDPATAFELGRRWGVEHFEMRYAHRWRAGRIPDPCSYCLPALPRWCWDSPGSMS